MVLRISRGVVLLSFLLLIASGGLVHAVEYGGLGGIPANPDPTNPRTKSIFVYTLSPGRSKQDAVNVINNTAETKTVEVYATDSEIASGGSFACRQKVEDKTAVGSWIKLSSEEVQLLPSTNKIVPFTVTVPQSTSVGEHNGCIVIQEKATKPEQTANGVQLSFRSALRVAITIPGDIVKDVDFSNLTLKGDVKKYTLKAELVNKGNVSLDTDVKVTVNNLFNKTVYQNGGTYPLLAQKTPAEFNFEFSRPYWGGFYWVRGVANYNGDSDAPLGSTAPKNVRKNAPSKLLFIGPQPTALGVYLLVLLVLLVLIWRLVRRLARRKRTVWREHTVSDGDTLNSLARRVQADWKVIAKANKLKAPYELEPGRVIKLPLRTKSK